MRMRLLPESVEALIDSAAEQHHVSVALARAIAWVESRGEQSRVSPKGAIGIMQLMPATAKDLGVDPNVAASNVFGGVAYIARMLRKYGGDEELALAAYNLGPGNVDDAIAAAKAQQESAAQVFPASVNEYVRNVLARKAEEGSRAAVLPFVSRFSARLACPHCSGEVVASFAVEVKT